MLLFQVRVVMDEDNRFEYGNRTTVLYLYMTSLGRFPNLER